MELVDSALLKAIHSGKSYILVGSGLSIGSGYPSWSELASMILEENRNSITPELYSSMKMEMKNGNSQELINFFGKIEKQITKTKLVKQIETIFAGIHPHNNELYSIISKWPINCYLTTN